MKFRVLMLACLLTLAVACQSANGGGEMWSGFLEGNSIDVSAQVGGRIAQVGVQEGEVVQAEQILLTIDDEFIRLQSEIADANVAAAQAQLALLEAGARPEDLQRAEARVEQARAALIAASQTLSDTEAIRANPQTLVILKTDAEARAQAAAAQLIAAARQAEAADLEYRFWEEQTRLLEEGVEIRLPGGQVLHFDTPSARIAYAYEEWNQAGTKAWQAWANVAVAQANADAAAAALNDISDQLANPIALDARVNQARAARDRAAANLQAAQAALEVLREGASSAQIQAARATLDQARAARAVLDQEAARYRITAPRAGTVTRVAYRVGEIAAPTTALVRLSVAGEMKLRVFVPMAQLDRMRLNQAVTIVVPELNQRRLNGTVTHIADRAEFSGREAQTDSERNAQLVAVEVTLRDADALVKEGMPASIVLGSAPWASAPALPAPRIGATAKTFSGSLEAKQTRIAAELGGRVVAVRVNRGDAVQPGDILVELDDAAIQASLHQAQAAVRAAQSNLEQVREKARPGAIALAEASVAQAGAELQAAQAARDDATRARANPQEIVSQIHLWEGKEAAAQGEVTRAEATRASIQQQVELARNDQSLSGKTRLAILQKQQQAAEATLAAARAILAGSQRVLAQYRALRDMPLELDAAQRSAANQVAIAEAGLAVAQAELAIATRTPQAEAVVLAEARLRAAHAGLKMAQAQAARHTLTSPVAGTVVGRAVEPGEVVRVGAPLLTIAETRELEMTVYVPIQDLGAVKLGQAVSLRLPSLPGKAFPGKVAYVSPEAEFKPANIYNSEERSEMVFAVRVTVPNPGGELKAGLPADVTFAEE